MLWDRGDDEYPNQPRGTRDFLREVADRLERGEISAREAMDAALFASKQMHDAMDVTIPVSAVLFALGHGEILEQVNEFTVTMIRREEAPAMFRDEDSAGGFAFGMKTTTNECPVLNEEQAEAVMTANIAFLQAMGIDIQRNPDDPTMVEHVGPNVIGRRKMAEEGGSLPTVDIDKEVEAFSRELDKEIRTAYEPGDMNKWLPRKDDR